MRVSYVELDAAGAAQGFKGATIGPGVPGHPQQFSGNVPIRAASLKGEIDLGVFSVVQYPYDRSYDTSDHKRGQALATAMWQTFEALRTKSASPSAPMVVAFVPRDHRLCSTCFGTGRPKAAYALRAFSGPASSLGLIGEWLFNSTSHSTDAEWLREIHKDFDEFTWDAPRFGGDTPRLLGRPRAEHWLPSVRLAIPV